MIARWRELSASERRMLVSAATLSLAMRVALAVVPWRSLARTRARHEGGGVNDAEAIRLVRWAIGVCSRRLPGQTCLSAALAAQRLLARHGIASTVEVGTYRDEQGETAFHAMASSHGVPIVGERAMTVLASVRAE